jgi:hypothetical protein
MSGAGGGFTYDEELCDCTLDGDGGAICTMTKADFETNVRVPTTCDDQVNEIERLECDDGTVRYQWIEDFDQGYRVVLDAASDLRLRRALSRSLQGWGASRGGELRDTSIRQRGLRKDVLLLRRRRRVRRSRNGWRGR